MAHEKVTKSPLFYTVCTSPDMCKVQAGSAIVVLPFIVKGEFKECENVSPDVEARGYPVVWKSESFIPKVTGDDGGNRYGVKSQTKESEAKAVQGALTQTANGHEVVRQGDTTTMNKGNTFGKIFYRGGSPPLASRCGTQIPLHERSAGEGQCRPRESGGRNGWFDGCDSGPDP